MTVNTPRTLFERTTVNVLQQNPALLYLTLGQAAFVSFIAYVRNRYYMLRYKLRIVKQYFKYILYLHLYGCYMLSAYLTY